jgi:hypothetical protein
MQHHSAALAVSHPHARLLIGLVLSVSVLAAFMPFSPVEAGTAASVSSPFLYTFNADGTLVEAGSSADSSSPYWWLNSGGYMVIDNGVGKTYQGSLPVTNIWNSLYRSSSGSDTDNGTHPQNLFRLVSRSSWQNVRVEAAYKINKDNFSASSNRNASNGLLLMSRYGDSGQTLYYAGVRVDGAAVIKKKYKGAYTTLAQKQIFPGTYVEGGRVNLLPHGKWITLRSETVNNSDGSVTIRLSMKKDGENAFTKLLEVKDTSSPISAAGYVGLRTDFMDVEFENLKTTKL